MGRRLLSPMDRKHPLPISITASVADEFVKNCRYTGDDWNHLIEEFIIDYNVRCASAEMQQVIMKNLLNEKEKIEMRIRLAEDRAKQVALEEAEKQEKLSKADETRHNPDYLKQVHNSAHTWVRMTKAGDQTGPLFENASKRISETFMVSAADVLKDLLDEKKKIEADKAQMDEIMSRLNRRTAWG